jgi:4-amino-4-deoxy-L-arabinose transferase-like glycosyltransferase
VPFAIYLLSLEGAVAYWDTGEAQTVPWIFGIMHPTGFPAFTMLAGLFAHLLPFGAPSWRIALFCALAMSGAAWLVCRIGMELDGDPFVCAAAGWLFAFGSIAWTRGTRAEVHSLAAFFALAAVYVSLRWYRTGEPRVLAAGALAWGLGISTHPIVALLLPALLLLFLARLRRTKPIVIGAAVCALAAGLACYAYLPLRSAQVTAQRIDPTLALGIPPGRPFWDNDHPSSWNGFVEEISGTQFGVGGTLRGMVRTSTYVSALPGYWQQTLNELTPFALVLAIAGFFELARQSSVRAAFFLLAFVAPSAFGLAYAIEADHARYQIIGYALLAVFAGYAASRAARLLPQMRVPAALCVAALAVTLIVVNRDTFAQRSSPGAQAVIASVVEKTPRNAILIAPWLYATPLAYAAYVEDRLGDRIVETSWLSDDAQRVPLWARTRPVYVVGILFGSVPGFTTERISNDPDIWHVARSPAPSRSPSAWLHRSFDRRRTTTTSCWRTPFCTGTRGSRGPVRISMR